MFYDLFADIWLIAKSLIILRNKICDSKKQNQSIIHLYI